MKRRYETIFVVNPDLDDEVQKQVVEKLKTVITQHNGAVHHSNILGKQKLGYEVDGHLKGSYHYLGFEGEADVLRELERNLRLAETVIKFQSFRVEDEFNPTIMFFERTRPFFARGRGRGEFSGRDDDFGGDYGGRGRGDMGGDDDIPAGSHGEEERT